MLGFVTSGSADTAAITTITNAATHRAYPLLRIKSVSASAVALYWLENLETGARMFFNYPMLTDEVLTINFAPGAREVVSSFRGAVPEAMLRQSDFADFYLLPSANRIVMYAAQGGAGTPEVSMHWDSVYWAGDGA